MTGRAALPDVVPAEVEVVRVALPMRKFFDTTYGSITVRDGVLVRAVADDGTEGWGECSALPVPGYATETADGAEAVLRQELAAGRLGPYPGHPMASAAVEAALLHLRLAAAGTTLPAWVGAVRDRVPCGAVVGRQKGQGYVLDEVNAVVQAGYRRVKLKVVPGWDVPFVRAVQSTWPDLDVSVDANGSYRLEHLDGPLGELDGLGLTEIEQPLPAGDLAGLAEVARRLDTPVCLDESIASAEDVRAALAVGAVDHVCLKPGRVGGVTEALRIHDLCLAEGVPMWVGGMLSTGVGKAVEVALAALPGATLAGDLPASRYWFERDVTEPWKVDRDGTMAVRPLGAVRLP